MRAIMLNAADNVATALENLPKGAVVHLEAGGSALSVKLLDDIPMGHKLAVSAIESGRPVRKYGETMGVATRRIDPGEWVHVHNVQSSRGRGDVPG